MINLAMAAYGLVSIGVANGFVSRFLGMGAPFWVRAAIWTILALTWPLMAGCRAAEAAGEWLADRWDR